MIPITHMLLRIKSVFPLSLADKKSRATLKSRQPGCSLRSTNELSEPAVFRSPLTRSLAFYLNVQLERNGVLFVKEKP